MSVRSVRALALSAASAALLLTGCGGGSQEVLPTPTISVDGAVLGDVLNKMVLGDANAGNRNSANCFVEATEKHGVSHQALSALVADDGDDFGAAVRTLAAEHPADAALLGSMALRADFDACVDALAAEGGSVTSQAIPTAPATSSLDDDQAAVTTSSPAAPSSDDAEQPGTEDDEAQPSAGGHDPNPTPEPTGPGSAGPTSPGGTMTDEEVMDPDYTPPPPPPTQDPGAQADTTPVFDIPDDKRITNAADLEPGLVSMFSSFATTKAQEQTYEKAGGCLARHVLEAGFTQEGLRFLAGGAPLGTGSVLDHLPTVADRTIWASDDFVNGLVACTST